MTGQLTNFFSIIKKTFLSFLYPKNCAGCHLAGTYLCANCQAKIPRALSTEETNAIRAVYNYRDPTVKRLIWLLKYRGVKEIALILADIIYLETLEDLAETFLYYPPRGRVLVVPVPLSRQRQHQRGFNQAEAIARHFIVQNQENYELVLNNLVKVRDTQTQVTVKNREDRLKNLRGAFIAKSKSQFRGRTIIIIDDVSTTGATLQECEKVLKRAGATRIVKLALAHG